MLIDFVLTCAVVILPYLQYLRCREANVVDLAYITLAGSKIKGLAGEGHIV